MARFLLFSCFIFISLPSLAQGEIFFPEKTRQFGHIAYNSDGRRHIPFTNTGDSPLIITNVKTSCGCLVASWSKEPVLPGEWAEISLQFHTGGGRQGRFQKSITVYSSDSLHPRSVLRIRGLIMKEGDQLYDEEIHEKSVYQAKHLPLDSMSFSPMTWLDSAEQDTSYYLQINSHTAVDVSSQNQLIYDCYLEGDTLVLDYRYLEMGPSDPANLMQKHQDSFQMPPMPGRTWIIKATYNRREVLMKYAIEAPGCASLRFLGDGELLRYGGCGE